MTSVTVSNLPPAVTEIKMRDLQTGQYFGATAINGVRVVGEVFLMTSLGVARLTGSSKGGFYPVCGSHPGSNPQHCADYIVTGYKPIAALNLEVLL